MNVKERREHRYLFDSTSVEKVCAHINGIGELTRVCHSHPVTETIYFGRDPKIGHKTPNDCVVRINSYLVRMRRYMDKLSMTMEVAHDKIFFETKRACTDGMNIKERFEISGIDVVNILSKNQVAAGTHTLLKNIINSESLFPTVATQVYRYHWVHKNGTRVTIDTNIRIFSFQDSLYLGRFIGALDQGKLEIKFTKPSPANGSLEKLITDCAMYVLQDNDGIERMVKECFFRSLCK